MHTRFPKLVDHINNGPILPRNTILATIDAIGAYTNIPQQDGIDCLKEALDERRNQKIPSEFIAKVLQWEFIQPQVMLIFI